VNGNLMISPSAGEAALNLTLNQPFAANTFRVQDGGANLGTFAGVANINITGANGADTVTVNLDTRNYTGSITVNTGNGNDSVSIDRGSVGGSLNLNTGTGNDSVSLGTTSGLTVGGGVSATDTVGANAFAFGNGGSASRVATFLNVTGYTNVMLGGTAGDAVGGSATVNDSSLTLAVNIALRAGLTVNQNLTMITGSGADTIRLGSDTINGNTQVISGAGNDTVTLTAVAPSFGGDLSISGGAGNDSVNLSPGPSTVGGSLSISLTDGNDRITVNNQLTVNGNLNLTLGNGADSVTFDAAVNGDMHWTLGNGNDTVTIGNAPSGRLFWNSGNGNDSVTFGDATNAAGEIWNVQMQFGTGSDTLTLAGNGTMASPEVLTGFIDLGGPPGGNSFDPTGSLVAGTWVIAGPFTLQNV
jgi:hypothetical protein